MKGSGLATMPLDTKQLPLFSGLGDTVQQSTLLSSRSREQSGGEAGRFGQLIDLAPLETDRPPTVADIEHPISGYLNRLAPSSRRPQFSALDWIAAARRSSTRRKPCPGTGSAAPTCSRSGACSRSTIRPPPPIACSPRCAGYSRRSYVMSRRLRPQGDGKLGGPRTA